MTPSTRKGRSTPTIAAKIKLSAFIQPEPSDDELLFLRQLGLTHCYTWVSHDQTNYDFLAHLNERVKKAGLTLYNAGNFDVGKSPRIHLGLPGRDEDIEQFGQLLHNLSRVGIKTTTFTWEPDRVWSSPRGEHRFASTRVVNMDELKARPLTHERAYSLDELWENFAYFMKHIIPIAEETGVRLALHPNDPPTDVLGGIPCLINSQKRYEQAFEIANSSMLGMEFCTGCWLEGGDKFGDILAGIKQFVKDGRVFIAHFRNVSAAGSQFTETFLDDGYFDMYQVMKAFVENGYDGTMILDHTPTFAGEFGVGAGTAYAIGYMRALIERAEDELSSN